MSRLRTSLLLLGVGVGLSGCGSSGGGLEALNGTPMPYSVVMSGGWPTTQVIGSRVDLQLIAQNIGSPVPHLVVVFNGLSPMWKVLSAHGCGHGAVVLKPFQIAPAIDFGPLQKKATCNMTIHVVSKSAGNGSNTISISLFGSALHGSVGLKVPVNGGMELIGNVSP